MGITIINPSQGGVAPGGTTKQVYTKNSSTDRDPSWLNPNPVLITSGNLPGIDNLAGDLTDV